MVGSVRWQAEGRHRPQECHEKVGVSRRTRKAGGVVGSRVGAAVYKRQWGQGQWGQAKPQVAQGRHGTQGAGHNAQVRQGRQVCMGETTGTVRGVCECVCGGVWCEAEGSSVCMQSMEGMCVQGAQRACSSKMWAERHAVKVCHGRLHACTKCQYTQPVHPNQSCPKTSCPSCLNSVPSPVPCVKCHATSRHQPCHVVKPPKGKRSTGTLEQRPMAGSSRRHVYNKQHTHIWWEERTKWNEHYQVESHTERPVERGETYSGEGKGLHTVVRGE